MIFVVAINNALQCPCYAAIRNVLHRRVQQVAYPIVKSRHLAEWNIEF